MEKSQKLEKIEAEFELYEADNLWRLEDVLLFIKDRQNESDKAIVEMRKHLRKNKFRKVISVILGCRCTEFGYFLPTDYNINEGLINLEFAMLTSYWYSLEKLSLDINDDNVNDVYRLASFIVQKYGENIERIENVRIHVEKTGSYIASRIFSDTISIEHQAVVEFFDKAVKNTSYVEKMQYTKK